MKAELKPIADYFRGSKARRSFFKGHELIAYDCGQLFQMERGYASVGLGPPDGKPQMSVLLAVWKRARDSWKRVTEALPAGELKDEMELELQIREAAMDRIADQAEALVEGKGINGHA